MEKLFASFNGDLKIVDKEQLVKFGVSEADFKEAKANTLIPQHFDAERNFDVIPVVFSLAVVNQFNHNHDGMDTATALDALEHFKNKPINIEHKKDQIVGHIINASFSDKEPEFNEGNIDNFKDKNSPFYITAAGLIYSNVFPDLAEALVDAADPTSPMYGNISASWEIAFGNFEVVSGTDKNLQDGEVLSEEDKQNQLHNLVAFGGTGKDDNGKPLMRLITKPAFPLGAALTLSPAARVKGVHVEKDLFAVLSQRYSDKKENKSSHLNKLSVRKGKSHIMDEKQFQQLLAKVVETLQKNEVSEASQKSLVSEIRDALEVRSKEWEQEKEDKQNALAAKEQELKDLQEQLNKLQKDYSDNQKELDQVKAQIAASEQNARLQRRMKLVEDKFDLSDQESEIVASEVAKLGAEDGDFDEYAKKLDILFAHKNKEAIARKQAEDKGKEDKTEDKENGEELETKASSTPKVPNTSTSEEKSLFERVKENLSISIN